MKNHQPLCYVIAFIALGVVSCKSHDDKDLNTADPVAAFEVAEELPKDSTCILTNISINANTYAWSVSPADGVTISDPAATNVALKFIKEGKYEITLEAKKQGSATSTLKRIVQVTASPIAGFDYKFANANIVVPVKVKFDPSPSINATHYQWTIVNGPAITGDPANPDSVLFTISGTYVVRLTALNGIGRSVSEKTLTFLAGPDFRNTKNPASIYSDGRAPKFRNVMVQ